MATAAQHYEVAEALLELATEHEATDYLHEQYLIAKAQAHATLALVDATSAGGQCQVCGCTDDDCAQCIAKTGHPCAWVNHLYKNLCTACVA